MLNYIWAGMIILSLFVSVFTGKTTEVTNEIMKSAAFAVEMCIKLLGIMCFWTGLMGIAEKSGAINIAGKIIMPLTKFIFPEIAQRSKAMNAIVSNMVANILGLSNAATPFGIAAMKELHKLSGRSGTATNAMCMFVVINTASIQLIPSTVIAIRAAAGSSDPFEIIVPVWFASIIAASFGIVCTKIFEKFERKETIPLRTKKAG